MGGWGGVELVFRGVGEGGREGEGRGDAGNENLQMGSSDGCSPNRRQAEVPLPATVAAARSPPKCALRKEIMGDGRKGVTWVIDMIEHSRRLGKQTEPGTASLRSRIVDYCSGPPSGSSPPD